MSVEERYTYDPGLFDEDKGLLLSNKVWSNKNEYHRSQGRNNLEWGRGKVNDSVNGR